MIEKSEGTIRRKRYYEGGHAITLRLEVQS